MSDLPWGEVVPALLRNPEMASVQDVARMAAQWMACRAELERLMCDLGEWDCARIKAVLEDER